MVDVNSRHRSRKGSAAEWAAANPTGQSGELFIVTGGSLIGIKVADGVTPYNSLPGPLWVEDIPELAVADAAELSLSTAGGVTTLGLLDTIARNTINHRSGYYYVNVHDSTATQAFTQNGLFLWPVVLTAGTLDRIGCEVTTGVASGSIRVGVYADNDGLPNTLIAEGTSGADTYPLDATAAAARDAAISASIPKNGVYWLALVVQGATGVALRTCSRGVFVPVPTGTTVPSGTTVFYSRLQSGVTGALPSTVTTTATNSSLARMHYRYA